MFIYGISLMKHAVWDATSALAKQQRFNLSPGARGGLCAWPVVPIGESECRSRQRLITTPVHGRLEPESFINTWVSVRV